jgi:hypothetical protein
MHENEACAGKYFYCVIRSPEPRELTTRGIGERGDKVYTVHYKDLAAVVSDSPTAEYDSSRRNMMAHTAVLEEVMAEFTILPVRFGIVAPNEHAIREQMLKRRYNEFDRLLRGMDGRVELGLKTFWYEDVVLREIVDEQPTVRQLRDGLVGRPTEETYYERIRLGELVEKAMYQKRDGDAAYLLNRLRPLAYDIRVNKVITERMVLNAAFLVEREREPEFDQTIRRMDAELGQRMLFKYIGSAPPYNFVNIVIRWD